MIKTVLELDLVGYSAIAATLEEGLGVETSPQLNQQIQGFVDVGLKVVGVSRESTVMQTTGDGAILVFDKPSQAHVFADAVQLATRTHNASKSAGIGKCVFRIGVATGDLVMAPKPTGGFDIAGMTIARAVRLEAKAKPGEVLCDTKTFAGLTAKQQKIYSGVETITGKRDEKFKAHRCILNPDGVKDATFFTGEMSEGKSASTPPKPNPATQPPKVNRKEILELFKQVKPHQFDDLVFLLEVPIARRPAETNDLKRRTSELLKWAEEADSGLANLLLELRELVGAEGGSPLTALSNPELRSTKPVGEESTGDSTDKVQTSQLAIAEAIAKYKRHIDVTWRGGKDGNGNVLVDKDGRPLGQWVETETHKDFKDASDRSE